MLFRLTFTNHMIRSQQAEGSKIYSSPSYLPLAKNFSFVYIRCHLSCISSPKTTGTKLDIKSSLW